MVKSHLDEFTHLQGHYAVTVCVKETGEKGLFNFSHDRLKEMHAHYTRLVLTISQLETDKIYIPVCEKVKLRKVTII